MPLKRHTDDMRAPQLTDAGEDSGSLDSDVANPRPPDHEPGTGVESRKRNASWCAPPTLIGALNQVLNDPNCFTFQKIFPGGFTPQFGAYVLDASAVAGLRAPWASWTGTPAPAGANPTWTTENDPNWRLYNGL